MPIRALLVLAILCSLPLQSAEAFCGFFVPGADRRLYNNAPHVVSQEGMT